MTIEELTEALEKAQTSISKLEQKNSELIDREKAAKTAAEQAEEEREEALRTSAAQSGNIETVTKSLNDAHAKTLKTLNAKLETLTIDNAIATAISTNGVLPHFAPAVTAMLRAGAKLDKNGDAITDTGLPLTDKITGFFAGEDARHYVAAATNTGGGAQGSSAVATKWSSPPEVSQINEWAEWAVKNTTEANALATSWRRPDLEV